MKKVINDLGIMSNMPYNSIRLFINGFILPAVFISVFVVYVFISGNYGLFAWEIILTPFAWGIWNSLYPTARQMANFSIGWWGALLGFIFGLSTVIRSAIHNDHANEIVLAFFPFLNVSTFDFYFHKLALIWLPVLYLILWTFIVKHLNNLWRLKA